MVCLSCLGHRDGYGEIPRMTRMSITQSQPPSYHAAFGIERLVATVGFAIGAILLFASSPHHGEFWWSDSPRHALNGAFIMDLIGSMPSDPKTWAMQYYVQYPALTILFYPPLFYVTLAPFYALFGVSHSVAVMVVL